MGKIILHASFGNGHDQFERSDSSESIYPDREEKSSNAEAMKP